MKRYNLTPEELAAIKELADKLAKIRVGETNCHRCNGGPGDPGCGKLIHLDLDACFSDACVQLYGFFPEENAE
jgi:hypothetical protein